MNFLYNSLVLVLLLAQLSLAFTLFFIRHSSYEKITHFLFYLGGFVHSLLAVFVIILGGFLADENLIAVTAFQTISLFVVIGLGVFILILNTKQRPL